MISKQNIQKSFNVILLVVILFFIFLPKQCRSEGDVSDNEPTIKTVTDTIWKETHDTITKRVIVISFKDTVPKGDLYTMSENLDSIKFKFAHLLKQHTRLSVYEDTLRFDSLGIKGTLRIKDVIWLNKFKGKRQYVSDLKIPQVTTTITETLPAPEVRQFYLGGNIFGDQNRIQLITPGLIYKDKKDRIIQANLGINFDGSLTYGVGSYWKISFRKKK